MDSGWPKHIQTIKSSIFCNITSCGQLKVNRRFGGTCRLHIVSDCHLLSRWFLARRPWNEGDMFLRNVDWFSMDAKIELFTISAVRTSNPTHSNYVSDIQVCAVWSETQSVTCYAVGKTCGLVTMNTACCSAVRTSRTTSLSEKLPPQQGRYLTYLRNSNIIIRNLLDCMFNIQPGFIQSFTNDSTAFCWAVIPYTADHSGRAV
jgi:hypothetical protein